MYKTREIYNFIDSFAPFDSAMSFDNVGILVNCGDAVKKALVCLDITDSAINEAIKQSADLIISHHPVIFRPLKSISKHDIVFKLIQNNITAISAHTNLDMGVGGVNDTLAKILNLKNIKPFSYYNEYRSSLCGELEVPMTVQEFITYVKKTLSCNSVKYTESNKEIKTVALCSGAGGDILFSSDNEADAFVTGEVKHHEFIMAQQKGIVIVEAGHFETENIIVKALSDKLAKAFPNMEFILFNDKRISPYSCL